MNAKHQTDADERTTAQKRRDAIEEVKASVPDDPTAGCKLIARWDTSRRSVLRERFEATGETYNCFQSLPEREDFHIHEVWQRPDGSAFQRSRESGRWGNVAAKPGEWVQHDLVHGEVAKDKLSRLEAVASRVHRLDHFLFLCLRALIQSLPVGETSFLDASGLELLETLPYLAPGARAELTRQTGRSVEYANKHATVVIVNEKANAKADGWRRALRVLPTGSKTKRSDHVYCTECGGFNVQYQTWIDPNTDTVVGNDGRTWQDMQDAALSWCSDCDDHTLLADN